MDHDHRRDYQQSCTTGHLTSSTTKLVPPIMGRTNSRRQTQPPKRWHNKDAKSSKEVPHPTSRNTTIPTTPCPTPRMVPPTRRSTPHDHHPGKMPPTTTQYHNRSRPTH